MAGIAVGAGATGAATAFFWRWIFVMAGLDNMNLGRVQTAITRGIFPRLGLKAIAHAKTGSNVAQGECAGRTRWTTTIVESSIHIHLGITDKQIS